MAYDLHIVRTESWLEAASAPITKQDVDALVAADSELVWSTTDYVDMEDDEGAVTRYYYLTWRGESCFWWYRDQIECASPSKAQKKKLVEMSRALGARVVGDDDEEYPLEQKAVSPDGKRQRGAQCAELDAGDDQESALPVAKRLSFAMVLLAAFLLGCVLLALRILIFGH